MQTTKIALFHTHCSYGHLVVNAAKIHNSCVSEVAPVIVLAFETTNTYGRTLRADVSKYRPEVYKSDKSKILKKIDKVALAKLLT